MLNPFEDHQAWLNIKALIVELAQQEIMSRFNQVGYEIKQDGSLLTEADTSMQQQTTERLKKLWPQFAVLGEESSLETQQAALENPNGCWVLDPVDGTTNFANRISFFSVSLALFIKGRPVLGLVYDPARDELFSARVGLGAELNNQPLHTQSLTPELKHCVGIIDFKRLTPKLATALVTQAPYASQRSFGSVALDWCWIAAGRGQIYLHGNQSLWDYAAGWLILEEAGGASCSLDDQPVLQNKIGKRSAVAAINSTTLRLWQTWIQQHS